ncbi:MAG: MATE family efflux transporter [Methanobacteriaceae archaeon]|nr:MATE family efflux transporter [Methanobacteriaceae archaeon]
MIKENTKGVDLILGDPKKAINKLSVPIFLSMLLSLPYNIIDGIWISNLSPDALAAIGFVSPIYMLVVSLGTCVTSGASPFISRCIGAKDHKRANNAAIHSILIMGIITIILTTILVLFLKDILLLMGASQIIDLSMEYGLIISLGSFTIFFSSIGAGILRSEGDMKRATYLMFITSIINIILDPIFIFTLNLGIGGAAFATFLSSLISLIVLFYWLFMKKNTYLSLKLSEFHYDSNIIKEILVVALPVGIENFIISFLAVFTTAMLTIVAGINGVAIYNAGWRIIYMGIVPSLSIASAVINVAGSAYGSKNYNKIEIICNYSLKLGIFISSIFAIIIFIFADQFTFLFTFTGASTVISSELSNFLRVLSLLLILYPIGIIITSIFQAMGKGFISMILTIIRELIFVLFASYLLGFTFGFGQYGIWWGFNIGMGLGSILTYIVFKIYFKRFKIRDKSYKIK